MFSPTSATGFQWVELWAAGHRLPARLPSPPMPVGEVFIVDALRTPIGKVNGVLAEVRPDDLAAMVVRALLARHPKIDPATIDDVYWGAANQAGEDNRDVARMAVLIAGLPVTVPGVTVNRLCASGMSAVVQGAQAIRAGEAEVVIAGGSESMTRAPFVVGGPDRGYPKGLQPVDTRLGWRLVNAGLHLSYPAHSLGETAEIVAEKYGVSRERQDEFALTSHMRAHIAWEAGAFENEVVGVAAPKGATLRDEGIRTGTSLEALAALRPAFRDDGTVTAGNSSQISDGAAGMILASEKLVNEWGIEPLARYVSSGVAGVHPDLMGIGPVPATQKVLGRTGWTMESVERVELNEAFAAQALAVIDELKLDPDRTNMQGGAIALGHPLGCTGARLVTTLAHQLKAAGGSRGLATMCVGVGQGTSVLLERP